MNYINITKDNIDKEHICCAMSSNQSIGKKNWMKGRFDDGLVFYRSQERGKCFIEYLPAENAWAPIEADGFLFINCLWVSGSFKGHGYSNDLLEKCIDDAKKLGKKGLCILSSNAKKKEFLADQKYLSHKGFVETDCTDTGINIMTLFLEKTPLVPHFRECAKRHEITEKGFVIYYTDQCPFTAYWVNRVAEAAKENSIEVKTVHITDRESAQNLPAPAVSYALFYDGRFVTHSVQSDKKFLELAGKLI